jgi:light-regulated signal transduction histidine kinase (bacteriophytochrome)
MIKLVKNGVRAPRAEDKGAYEHNATLASCIERQASELRLAHAEMDAFTRSISHDLRSPLTVIGGFAELLTKNSSKVLDTKGRHYLSRITSSASDMGRMLDEFHAFSRMSRSEMHMVPIDLKALANKVTQGLDAEKGGRRVVWVVGRLPTIEVDPTLLREAITRLASNALKFTRSRKIARIRIGARRAGRDLVFFVRDNGAHQDIKSRERSFGSHDRQNSSSKWSGSPIELAYVQRIIQRHGGRTWAEAVPSGGATFYFSLPVGRAKPRLRPKLT